VQPAPIEAIDRGAILASVWGKLRRPQGCPEAQMALVAALIGAMGALSGQQPDLRAIAARLGVGHQRIYKLLRVLEVKGIVVRGPGKMERHLEIRLRGRSAANAEGIHGKPG
jgi:DNA-binding MarR family transcriptional regulator